MHTDLVFVVVPAWPIVALVLAASAGLTAALIVVLTPVMRRYAMARPSARGLHATPTPQGAGLAIMLAILALAAAGLAWSGAPLAQTPASLAALLAGASALAALGAADDILQLGAGARLLAQFAAAAAIVWTTPTTLAGGYGEGAVLLWLAATSVGLVWFVNLTNFMDGMDGMTVVGLGAPALFVALANLAGHGDPATGLVCLAAVGGLIGFFPFNAPRARLFLGDVGSLSLGLIVGAALLRLAAAGHPIPALIAPLYYLADATITLGQRAARGENLAQAHRSHFYQRAVTGGMSAWGVLARVGALNLALAGLAGVALVVDPKLQFAALLIAAALVGLTLRRLARGA